MKQAGWPQRRVLWMWSAVVLVSALSAAAGSPHLIADFLAPRGLAIRAPLLRG
jgi:hypothetical protein